MLDEYRRKYSAFNTACMREHYLFLSGQKASLEIALIYEQYAELFGRESIDMLTREIDNTPDHFDAQQRSLLHLLAFAVEQFLEDSVKHLTEAISDFESAASVHLNGTSMTFQDAAVGLAREPEREVRRKLYEQRVEVIANSNDLRVERLEKLHLAARSLGYPGYRALFERLREIDYIAVAREAEKLLAGTETVFASCIAAAIGPALGLIPEQTERHDAIYFLHLNQYDDWFPSDQILPVYKRTMFQLGVEVDSQTNITIDSEPRSRKTARAFCMPVSVPEDIKLVVRTAGGQSDYQSLLHESGHAQHYGWTSASLLPEFRYTGDYALTETYAFLFNHLISDPDWLVEMLRFSTNDAFIRSAMLARLVTIRRYAAKLRYEIRLHDGEELDSAANIYGELQTAATGFRTGGTEYLYDLDDGFYAAGYLRAWALEVALREYLKTRFGKRWWASRRAGSLLKELWETGDRHTADEIAQQIGIAPISFDLLIDEFNNALR